MLLEITPNYFMLLNILIVLSVIRSIATIICGLAGTENPTAFGTADVIGGMVNLAIIAVIMIV